MHDREIHRKMPALAVTLAAAFIPGIAAAQPSEMKGPLGAPAPGPREFLQAVNETQGLVKLEFLMGREDQSVLWSACLTPRESVRWSLPYPTGRGVSSPMGKIRMQVMRGQNCDEGQQVACERSLDQQPGLRYVTLRGEGGNCGIFPMPEPVASGLKQGAGGNQLCGDSGKWAPLWFTNKDPKRSMWLTVYTWHSGLAPYPIRATGCWAPGERRMACLDPSRQILQAEMYEPGRAGLCRGTQTCKTRMDARLPPQNLQPVLGSSVELHPNGTNCYWSKIQ